MKLIYSQLQKFLPDLDKSPQTLRDDLTLIGHFCNFYEQIDSEIVFDLDIKVNRGDCLGYYGICRDLSVFYNIPLLLPPAISYPQSNYSLPIKVETDNVVRVMAAKIVHIKNGTSPSWLKTFLKLHNVNSINTLVDLTNYIMFLYGIPSHAFDTSKSTDNLIWQMNPGYSQFTSLDDSILQADKNILMINNPSQPLSLSFWGGTACAIDSDSTNTIIEIAVYNPSTVRQNTRQLKVTTEAATRLEKELDPDTIPLALNHLISLILDNCGGTLASQIFDHYPNPIAPSSIEFDPSKPSLYSGIDIPNEFSLKTLDLLGCISSPLVKEGTEGRLVLMTPPSIRKDISLEEDLIEEVVRFWGFQHIPTDSPLTTQKLPDITPPIYYLIEQLKDKLVKLGYDEVLTWPLVAKPTDPSTAVFTQNSINSEYPVLRQSMIQSLQVQLDQYTRYKLPQPQFFEIGKIYSCINGTYQESYALGLYHHSPDQLKKDLEIIKVPLVKEGFREIGSNFAEVILDNLPTPTDYIPEIIDGTAIELTSQIITLDANVSIEGTPDTLNLIRQYSAKIDPKLLWSIEIVDIYPPKYTFRVSYYNCDDKTAKSTHLKAFDLN